MIAQPIDKTVFALDPDIPPAAQRLRLAPSQALPRGWRWRLDGRVLGAATPIAWSPWPGAHKLELLDAQGAVREIAAFEVRGATLRRGSAKTVALAAEGAAADHAR